MKGMTGVLGLAALTLFSACATSVQQSDPGQRATALFDVLIAQKDHAPVSRAQVYLVYRGRAPRLLGETNSSGQVRVEIALLNDHDVLALIACPQEVLLNCGGIPGEKLWEIRREGYNRFIIPVPLESVY